MNLLFSQILWGVPVVSPLVQETTGTGETPIAEEAGASPDDKTKGFARQRSD
jgi:hypothetical protein